MLSRIMIRSFEAGLLYRDGEFRRVLPAGRNWVFNPFLRKRVQIVSRREPWLPAEQLDQLVDHPAIKDQIEVIDLNDHQRALVWIDGRLMRLLGPGKYAYWSAPRDVRVQVMDARDIRVEHKDLKVLTRLPGAAPWLDVCTVERHHVGVLFIDGRFDTVLEPGLYAFWKGSGDARVVEVDMREMTIDVSGQEIMTSDKVTLRLNALVTYKVVNSRRAVEATDDVRQSLYREAQLALRGVVGARELDSLLAEKDAVAAEIEADVRRRAQELGLSVAAVGIRDVILPGDMKELMNRVTEAKKAAEANLIARREETAAIRSQANTAKLLADNATLMRLRELEVLEKIATTGNLNVVLGEKGLSERVVNLL